MSAASRRTQAWRGSYNVQIRLGELDRLHVEQAAARREADAACERYGQPWESAVARQACDRIDDLDDAICALTRELDDEGML